MRIVLARQNPQLYIGFGRRLLRGSRCWRRRLWCRRRHGSRFRRILLHIQLVARCNSHHWNLWRRQRLHAHRRAFATSRRARHRNQIARRQKEFAALRNDQSRASKLLLQSNRAARCDHAQRIVHIQSRDDVAVRSANVQRRGNHRRGENPQRRARGKLQMNAPEIQRERDRRPGLQQREFRRSANIHLSACNQRQARFSVVHGQHAAVEYEGWRIPALLSRTGYPRSYRCPLKHHSLRRVRSLPAALAARANPAHKPVKQQTSKTAVP